MSTTIPEDGGLDRIKEGETKTVAGSSAGIPFVLLPVCLDDWPRPPCHDRLTPQKPWANKSLSLKLSVPVLRNSDDKSC